MGLKDQKNSVLDVAHQNTRLEKCFYSKSIHMMSSSKSITVGGSFLGGGGLIRFFSRESPNCFNRARASTSGLFSRGRLLPLADDVNKGLCLEMNDAGLMGGRADFSADFLGMIDSELSMGLGLV